MLMVYHNPWFDKTNIRNILKFLMNKTSNSKPKTKNSNNKLKNKPKNYPKYRKFSTTSKKQLFN